MTGELNLAERVRISAICRGSEPPIKIVVAESRGKRKRKKKKNQKSCSGGVLPCSVLCEIMDHRFVLTFEFSSRFIAGLAGYVFGDVGDGPRVLAATATVMCLSRVVVL